MDEFLDSYVEMIMQQQEVTNGIKFFSWLNFSSDNWHNLLSIFFLKKTLLKI